MLWRHFRPYVRPPLHVSHCEMPNSSLPCAGFEAIISMLFIISEQNNVPLVNHCNVYLEFMTANGEIIVGNKVE